jgi:dihydrofolate reductase
MRLTSTVLVSLDGVIQAPGGPDEDRSVGFEHGGWSFPYRDPDFGGITERFSRADAFLLGRRTYEIFASSWPNAPRDNPISIGLNDLPKYVVTRTLDSVKWENSEILKGDLSEAVSKLKSEPGRELQIHGSTVLVRALLALGLIDELQLLTFPVSLGSGRRLFEDLEHAVAFELTDHKITNTGVVVTTYVPKASPTYGSFA